MLANGEYGWNTLLGTTGATVCTGDTVPLPLVSLKGVQAGFLFKAYVNGVPASDFYEAGFTGDQIVFDISSSYFTQPTNKIEVWALTCDTYEKLTTTIDITLNAIPGPDKSLDVSGGGAVCPGNGSSVTIRNAQPNTTLSLIHI